MKHDEFIERLKEVFLECVTLADIKNHDYAHVEDALENFRDFGVHGIIVRLGDKYYRLKNITQKGEHKVNESMSDTLRDTLIYSAIALILLEETEQPKSPLRCSGCDYIAQPGDVVDTDPKSDQWKCPDCGLYWDFKDANRGDVS